MWFIVPVVEMGLQSFVAYGRIWTVMIHKIPSIERYLHDFQRA
jgi:hypothetical protein